jgi:hypothetical protein
MTETRDSARDARPAAPRRPYATPTLTVFGTVATLTGTQSMTGTNMDGGPNNSKT